MTIPLLLMAGIILTASAADLGFGGPSIQITSPSDNSTVPAGNVTVTVHTDDFNIVNQLRGANVNDSGHIHYFIDVGGPDHTRPACGDCSGHFCSHYQQ